MKAPINLRVEEDPYPHLRDDEGCVLARDYQHTEKMEFILEAVRRMQASLASGEQGLKQNS